MTQKLKPNTKMIHAFFWNFHLPLKVWVIHENAIIFLFFFWKWVFYSFILIFLIYSQYFYCHQNTNHHEQPIPKSKRTLNQHIHIHLHILIFYTHKPFPFHFITYFIQKSQLFLFKNYKLIRVTQVRDSWSRTSE